MYWDNSNNNHKRDITDLRIAYFAGSMQPGQDGVTRVLYNLITELNSLGIQNIFFSPIIPPPQEQPTKMFKVPSLAFPLYKDYRLALPSLNAFRKRLEEFKPDLIHFNSPCTMGFEAAKYGTRFRVPVVATYHTHFASYGKYYRLQSIEKSSWNYFRRLYNKCEKVYVPSRPILKQLESHGIKNLMFLPHGVDSSTFNPKFRSQEWRRSFGIEDKTVLLYSGRLVWEKDLLTLAKTYKILGEKQDDIIFMLSGDGPIKKELRQMMPRAIFLGYQSDKKLSTTYASSDILVFPSTTETFGNVTIEAMASGIPAICVREGGAYDVVENGVTGLIAEPRNAEDLAEKILILANDKALRLEMGRRALKFAREQTWKNIFSRLFESYMEVVNSYQAIQELKVKI